MVQVSVRENDGFDLVGSDRRRLPVALAPFFLALKESAIHQHLQALPRRIAGKIDEVLGAGYSSGGAEKLDVGHLVVVRFQSSGFSRQSAASFQLLALSF